MGLLCHAGCVVCCGEILQLSACHQLRWLCWPAEEHSWLVVGLPACLPSRLLPSSPPAPCLCLLTILLMLLTSPYLLPHPPHARCPLTTARAARCVSGCAPLKPYTWLPWQQCCPQGDQPGCTRAACPAAATCLTGPVCVAASSSSLCLSSVGRVRGVARPRT